jgi:hypothetical protein
MGRIFHGHGALPPFLVVVDQFDIERVSALKPEYNTPVGPHPDGPKTLQVAFKRVQMITGKIHSLRCARPIKAAKNIRNHLQQVRPYPAPVAALIKPFQAAVFEAPDH